MTKYSFFNNTSNRKSRQGGIFSQIIHAIKKTLHPKTEEFFLEKRIQPFHQTIAEKIKDLQKLKNHFKDLLDRLFYTQADLLISALIRDALNFQKTFAQNNTVIQQTKIFKKYHFWLKKARTWDEVFTSPVSEESVTIPLFRHVRLELEELIEQDLQVIDDYKKHALGNCHFDRETLELVLTHLEEKLFPLFTKLSQLKEDAPPAKQKDPFTWKEAVNKERSRRFDEALHLIDEGINQYTHRQSAACRSRQGHGKCAAY